MKKVLVVVDMQNDFIDGALGTKEAVAIVDKVADKIRNFDGLIFVTYDTHFDNYLKTNEGKKLPVKHCIKNTPGWKLNDKIQEALKNKKFTAVEKPTFGSVSLPNIIKDQCLEDKFSIEIVGLCTDICVVSNALMLKSHFYYLPIAVDASCCAGVTPETHKAALETMKCCQIDIIGE